MLRKEGARPWVECGRWRAVKTRDMARGRIILAAALLVVVALGVADADARSRPDLAAEWRLAEERRQALRLEQARREHAVRLLRMRSAAAHARIRAGRGPEPAMRATKPNAALSCPVAVDGAARLRNARGSGAAFAMFSPFVENQGSGGGRHGRPIKPASASAGATRKATPHSPTEARWAVGAAAPAVADGERRHRVPLFPRASDPLREGVVRVVNRSSRAGEVVVDAVDDGGRRFGPVALAVNARATVHFNSGDLENGNAAKGLSGGVGAPGEGDWRLELRSDLDIEALAYVRAADGFLTAMHDLAPGTGGTRRVPIFNPGDDDRQASLLRLVNEGAADVEAVVRGVDDRGRSPGGGVRVAVPAGAARTLSAAQLESGSGPGVVAGTLGDGAGKWRLSVTASGPLRAMGLLAGPTGTMTNLSTAPPPRLDAAGDPVHRAPLFPSASDPFRQGFVRVVNRSGEAGEVTVRARDDSGRDYEPVTLALGANRAVHFNSDDLEQGNRAKGLSAGVGAGEGDWRLELRSDLDIEVLAYVRAADGLLTSMHDLVPTRGDEHLVAMFDPGGDEGQASLLRLVNDGGKPARVTIAGVDDRGAAGGKVAATVPAGRSLTLSAAQLESGSGPGVIAGALGDGAGKWRLTVRSDRPIDAMSLLRGPNGHLANLSTAPGAAAGDETAESFFAERVSPVVQSKCVNCHVEGGVSGNTRLVFVRSTNADHLALNRRAFADFLADVEGGAELILNKIQGGGARRRGAGGGGHRGPRERGEVSGAAGRGVRRPGAVNAGDAVRRRVDGAGVEDAVAGGDRVRRQAADGGRVRACGAGAGGPARGGSGADGRRRLPRVPDPRRQRPAADRQALGVDDRGQQQLWLRELDQRGTRTARGRRRGGAWEMGSADPIRVRACAAGADRARR